MLKYLIDCKQHLLSIIHTDGIKINKMTTSNVPTIDPTDVVSD